MLTRTEFDHAVRRLSVLDPGDHQHHCRVEICVDLDWRVMTDTCLDERNIPHVLAALCDLLWVYVSENAPDAAAESCRRLGAPSTEGVDKGMRMWPAREVSS